MNKWHKHFSFRVACNVAALIISGFAASATTFTLTNFADAFVTPGSSGSLSISNFGAAGALGISARESAQGEFQSVLLFDLSSATSFFNNQYGIGGWSLQSVSLRLVTTAPNNGIFNNPNQAGQFTISLMQSNNWVEGTGTPMTPTVNGITFSVLSNYVNVADISLGTFSFGGGTTSTNGFSLGLGSELSGDVLNGSLMSLRMFAADSIISYLVDSRNFNNAGQRPGLTIDAVPEPSTGALALLGMAAALLRRRRVGSKPAESAGMPRSPKASPDLLPGTQRRQTPDPGRRKLQCLTHNQFC